MQLSHEVQQPLDEIFHAKFFELLGQYMLLGGMPEIIAESLKQNNLSTVNRLQHSIIDAYRDDFPKYAKSSPFGIRFSTQPYSIENKLHSYPLYAIAELLAKYNPDLRNKLYSLISS